MMFLEKPQVTRPAAIVIRFSSAEYYQRAVKLYTDLFPDSLVSSEPGGFSSFQVGSAVNPKKRDMELRLELHLGDTTPMKNRTIIYWAIIPSNNSEATKAIKGELKDLGYGKEEKDTHSFMDEATFIVSDGDNNFFGGHPNPPFPPGGRGSSKRKLHVPVPGLLIGVLGGLVLASLMPAALGLRRTSE